MEFFNSAYLSKHSSPISSKDFIPILTIVLVEILSEQDYSLKMGVPIVFPNLVSFSFVSDVLYVFR